jgi:chemotaxis protein MotB
MKQIQLFLLLLVVAASAGACVSNRQYQSLENDYQRLLKERNALNDKLNILSRENAEQKRRLQEMETVTGDLQTMSAERESLQQQLVELQALMDSYRRDRDKEMGSLSVQMQSDREALQQKEDELAARSRQLEQMQLEMGLHHKRLTELEAILAKKDSTVNALRRKVSDALLGFEGKGLTVHTKNGKVYVSMEDKLLFRSGSYQIEPKGAEAIKKLAHVLAQNSEINVLIEGHTDDVPYHGSGELKDNWDLSVKRATTVVRALLSNTAIHPIRITAAGRSEYIPLDGAKTAEARQKNRRIEIILTPKLDELLEILE